MPSPDRLATYRRKRRAARTPEPIPDQHDDSAEHGSVFVIQEHHARRLHWDLRLERDGVLASWAVPRGLPAVPGESRLAVHTEDHPMEYLTFHGEIPAGEYGGGSMTVYDTGTYVTEKWDERHVIVDLSGEKITGRYALFPLEGDKQWNIRRLDPPSDPDHVAVPDRIEPMMAVPGELPFAREDATWAYEMKWDGVRAIGTVEGTALSLRSRRGSDITSTYPELGGLGIAMGALDVVLDGEVVRLGADGRPDFGALQHRMHVTDVSRARKLAESAPVTYLIFDLLHVAGRSAIGLPYEQRRALLADVVPEGPRWQVTPWWSGGGADVLAASREYRLEGILAKKLDSTYRPGQRSPLWRKVKNVRAQSAVIGGWLSGAGRRAGGIGSILLGIPEGNGLRFIGSVGTGLTDQMLDDLGRALRGHSRKTSPFNEAIPPTTGKKPHWVEPVLVAEVSYAEWGSAGRLRHPVWRGLRDDLNPEDVVDESE